MCDSALYFHGWKESTQYTELSATKYAWFIDVHCRKLIYGISITWISKQYFWMGHITIKILRISNYSKEFGCFKYEKKDMIMS